MKIELHRIKIRDVIKTKGKLKPTYAHLLIKHKK